MKNKIVELIEKGDFDDLTQYLLENPGEYSFNFNNVFLIGGSYSRCS